MNLHHQDPQENPCVCVECDLFGHFGVTSLLQECYLCGQWKLNYCTLARWHCCAKPFDVASQESLSQLPCQISPSLRRVGLGNRPYYRRLSSWRKKGHHPPILTKKRLQFQQALIAPTFVIFFLKCVHQHTRVRWVLHNLGLVGTHVSKLNPTQSKARTLHPALPRHRGVLASKD